MKKINNTIKSKAQKLLPIGVFFLGCLLGAGNAWAGFGTITNPIAGDNSAYSGESFNVYAEYDDTGCNDGVTISANSGSCTSPGWDSYPAGCGTHGGTATFTMSADPTIRCEIRIRGDASLSGEQITWRYVTIDQIVTITSIIPDTGVPASGVPSPSYVGNVVRLKGTVKIRGGSGYDTSAYNPVKWNATGACTVDADGVVTNTAAGTCTVNAYVDGTTNYTAAASSTISWTVAAKIVQIMTVTTPAPAGPIAVGASFPVAASAKDTGGVLTLPVTITTGLGGGCTASVTGVGAATITINSALAPCIVYYSQAGTWQYASVAQQSSSTTVSAAKLAQTITFPAQAAQTFVSGGTFPINPRATASSGFAVAYSSATPAVCTLSGAGNDVVTMVTAGTCTINANQAGNASYNAAPQVAQNITINKSGQAITVTQAAPATAQAGSTFTVTATSSSGLPVAITASGTCTAPGGATGSALITVGASVGACTVNYNQAGNANYNAASLVSSTTDVSLLMQTISVIKLPPSSVARTTPFQVQATASSGLSVGIAITGSCAFTIAPSVAGGVTSATIQYSASGVLPCVISYTQAGNTAYAAASTVQNTVIVNRTAQSITVGTPAPASMTKNQTFTVAATSSSGLAVAVTVSGGCSIAGNTITKTSFDSSCTVYYNQAGNDAYSPAAQVTNTIKDGDVPVIATVTAVPNPTNQTPEYTFSSNESGTIVYTGPCSSATTFAVAGNNTVTFNELAVGTYTTCKVKVVDAFNNTSNELTLPSFTVMTKVVAYVKPVASGTGDCSSWANACANIQTAINFGGVNEVWIAKGVYKPAATITLKAGVGVYGGFAGNESSYLPSYLSTYIDYDSGGVSVGADYGPGGTAANYSVISGDKDNNDIVDSRGLVLAAADIKGTNLTQLFTASNLTLQASKKVKMSNLVLNGATGAATGAALSISNSYVEVDRTQFVFNKGTSGGAIAVVSGGKLIAVDSVFLSNQSTAAAGAVVSSGSAANEVLIQNSQFESNIAGTNGGAIQHAMGKLWILNSTFFGNSLLTTTGSGGAVDFATLLHPSSADIRYATFLRNIAGTAASPSGKGGAISINTASTAVVTLANSLVLDNKALATTGTNIADMAKITDSGYNIVGFNGQSGMVTGINTAYDFVGGSSSTAPTVLVEDILEVLLANNGGYTASLKLKETSYARDKIPNIHADCEKSTSVSEDQRGYVRPDVSGNYCDIGAVELDNLDPCSDPDRQKGFFVMTYPDSKTTCFSNGNFGMSVGAINSLYLLLLSLIGIGLELKRRGIKIRLS